MKGNPGQITVQTLVCPVAIEPRIPMRLGALMDCMQQLMHLWDGVHAPLQARNQETNHHTHRMNCNKNPLT